MNTVIYKTHLLAEDESLVHHQALQYSLYYTKRYIDEHQIQADGLTAVHAMEMGCSRLEWALQQIRPQLSGKFTEDEILMVMDCFLGDHFYPDGFCSIPSALCDHHGIELYEYKETWLAPLVDKLRDLEPVQQMALGDALEQAWHRGMKNGKKPGEFLPTIGIELA